MVLLTAPRWCGETCRARSVLIIEECRCVLCLCVAARRGDASITVWHARFVPSPPVVCATYGSYALRFYWFTAAICDNTSLCPSCTDCRGWGSQTIQHSAPCREPPRGLLVPEFFFPFLFIPMMKTFGISTCFFPLFAKPFGLYHLSGLTTPSGNMNTPPPPLAFSSLY